MSEGLIGEPIEELLGRARGGDEAARDQLITWVEARFSRFVSQKLRGDFSGLRRHADTGDVVNLAILKLIPAVRGNRNDICASPLLFFHHVTLVIRHVLIDLARKNRGKHHVETLTDRVAEAHPMLQGSSGLSVWRLREQTDVLIGRLPDGHQQAFAMSYYLDIDVKAIASALDLSEGHVYRLLRESKEHLGRLRSDDDRKGEGMVLVD
jgi:RNA polymerase sigma factor (sigma-70 family)